MNTGQQTLIGNMQQRHSRGFIDAAALRFDDTVFDLIAHTQTMTAADAVSLQHQFNVIAKGLPVQRNRMALFKANGDFFRRDFDAFIPELDAHNRVHNLDAGVQEFKIFSFVRRAQHIGVG